jgi:ADP-ribose pyrophosphatase YjhB (NUDIX family)
MNSWKTVVRVYGLVLNDLNEVLVSDEKQGSWVFTKFPGGGLEFGEGTNDCLKRELLEELNIDATIGELFYVNDFFQASALHENHQLIAFYYRVNLSDFNDRFREKYAVPIHDEGERQRWIKINELRPEIFTFPIDQLVAQKLIESQLGI